MNGLPRISIVTPSYNQGQYLESTIVSVLNQNYPDLEYIIIDGGSTDNSLEIIKKYENRITYWVSEKDLGQYNAINKGFALSTGEIMAWINADDMYCPWAFGIVADVMSQLKEVEWLTTLFPLTYNSNDQAIACFMSPGYNKELFYEGSYCGLFSDRQIHYIQQESTFWRRSLWERSGGRLSEEIDLAADFDLWARFYEISDLYALRTPLAGFRVHDNQRSHQITQYISECHSILQRYGMINKLTIRNIIRRLHLNKIPVLRRYLISEFGYEVKIVNCNVARSHMTWAVNNHNI